MKQTTFLFGTLFAATLLTLSVVAIHADPAPARPTAVQLIANQVAALSAENAQLIEQINKIADENANLKKQIEELKNGITTPIPATPVPEHKKPN